MGRKNMKHEDFPKEHGKEEKKERYAEKNATEDINLAPWTTLDRRQPPCHPAATSPSPNTSITAARPPCAAVAQSFYSIPATIFIFSSKTLERESYRRPEFDFFASSRTSSSTFLTVIQTPPNTVSRCDCRHPELPFRAAAVSFKPPPQGQDVNHGSIFILTFIIKPRESEIAKMQKLLHCRSIESRIALATVLPPPARAITVFLNLQRKTHSQKNPNEDWAKSDQQPQSSLSRCAS
ncbi:hypothetical protein LR48_Vigan406s011700 [Vigna angularis]|uniref:Uncharacterized protein n=1 Tax=Phaseolus angularis TaxID=3914 RepID=A0A0L9T9S1_PHAAN|nr:uncharacterized protein HKW66_Vig0165540 [Vigna angularis]KOM27307.1 hypothetical protein LR48_Vigan406s011700 [Vigna angularis]